MEQKLIVKERRANIGDFAVGRLLPVHQKRQVGPITFLDHMGPAEIGNGKYMDVDQHPHIGLSTLTYLFEGEIEHHDSLGTKQLVGPGDVGFMTAGKGITHTERTPVSNRDGRRYPVHGYQVWIALPKEFEESDPAFEFVSKKDLPTWQEDGISLSQVAGNGFGMVSPVQVFSPLFIVDILSKKHTYLPLDGQLEGEIAVVVVDGSVKIDAEIINQRQMLISGSASDMTLEIAEKSRILLLGGEPFPEERFLLWNFVSSSKERLKQAKTDWIEKRFPAVPGDNTYIPFP